MKKKRILNFIFFLFACVGILHLINRLIAYKVDEKGRLSSVPGRFYNWNGDQIFYQVKGDGKPLLLLHDLKAASSGYEWDRVLTLLAKDHRVYAIDLIGCGRSAKPGLSYVAFYYVQLIQAFLRDIVRQKADIAASNSSTALAVSAASYSSELIDKIVLINPELTQPLDYGSPILNKCLPKLLQAPVIGTFIYNMIFTRSRLEADICEGLLYNPFNATDELIENCWAGAHRGDSKGRYFYASQLGGYLHTDPSAAYERAANDILVIYGEAFKSKEASEAWLKEIKPEIKTEEIGKSDRLPHFEEPEKFVSAVESFLAD